MKKITYSLLTLVVTAMGFASCENVPAPYDYPEDNKGGKTDVPGTYINETFTTGFGKFEVVTQAGKAWKPDFNTAKASGYDNKTKTNTPSESFLVSPEINLSKSTGAYLQFEYIFQYANNDGEDKVLITSDYTGDPQKHQVGRYHGDADTRQAQRLENVLHFLPKHSGQLYRQR